MTVAHERRRVSRHLAGDLARVLREALACVWGPVALVTVTQPGEFDNRTAAARWRALNGRLRVEMERSQGLRPPRIVVRVAQRQRRGADHLHCVFLARTPDERERMQQWVEAYRMFSADYDFGFVDDPFKLRRSRDGQMRDMVFEQPGIAGAYLGRYMTGGQLEQFLSAVDRSWRPLWVSPVLLEMSGWSLERCRWIRQGWHVQRGTWRGSSGPFGGLSTRLPSWWFRSDDRAWVIEALDMGEANPGPWHGPATGATAATRPPSPGRATPAAEQALGVVPQRVRLPLQDS